MSVFVSFDKFRLSFINSGRLRKISNDLGLINSPVNGFTPFYARENTFKNNSILNFKVLKGHT
jgi:hypothetical protein